MENFKRLAALPLFRGIPDLAAVLEKTGARVQNYEKGAVLLRRGETAEQMGVVLSGGGHIVREDFWGNRSIVGLAGPGDVFAESYHLSGGVLEVSALAAAETQALLLDVRRAGETALLENLVALLAEKNRMLTEKIRHMSRRTIREKLLSYLSVQALRAGSAEFDIPLDRQQLADYLAVDRSALSAELGKLRREGLLETRRNHFRLLENEDPDLCDLT